MILRKLALALVAAGITACSTAPADLIESDPPGAGFNPLTARSAFQVVANDLGLRCPTAVPRLGILRAQSVAITPDSPEWVGLGTELGRLVDACRNGRQL